MQKKLLIFKIIPIFFFMVAIMLPDRAANAQQSNMRTISGIVVDEEGEPLPGAHV